MTFSAKIGSAHAKSTDKLEAQQIMYIIVAFDGISNLRHMFKLRCKHLAMSTPRSVEVDDPRISAR